MAKAKNSIKKTWIVIMTCKVRKSVEVRNCTEKEAREQPWDFAHAEVEIDQIDWVVEKVTAND